MELNFLMRPGHHDREAVQYGVVALLIEPSKLRTGTILDDG